MDFTIIAGTYRMKKEREKERRKVFHSLIGKNACKAYENTG